MQRLRLLLILAVALLLAGTEARLDEAPALADANVVTSHAKIQASSFDGVGTVNPAVIKQDSGFGAFSESVVAFDDLNEGRSARGEATQNTTVDFADPLVSRVDTSGVAEARWTDGEAGDGDDPAGIGSSEFTVTFEVTNAASPFSLVGSIEAAAGATNVACTTVTVTSPSGATFGVSAPAGCGPSQQSIDESGELSVGTHTFSIVASALASNPNATGGTAEASFNLSLSLDSVAPVIDGVEFTQGVQQLQTLSELQASLGGGSSATDVTPQALPAGAGCENTPITRWEETAGGNGHYYQGICSSATWDEAEAALESAGKHLATITSGAENAFAYDLIDDAGFWSLAGDFCPGPFIGGNQTPGSPEPSGGWTWVTGEPFGYTNWAQDEPGDSDFANENRLAFGLGDCGPQVATAPVWHDVEGNESGVHSYVAEWDGEPVTVEFTQSIQQLQPISELQADLAGDGEPPVPIVAGKPAAMRVYFAEVEDATHYVVQVSGVMSGSRQVTLDPGCTPTDRRRQDAGCRSVDFFFTPPEGSWSLTLDVRDFEGTTILNEEFHLTSVKTKPLNIVAVPVCDGSGCGLASDVARAIGLLRATYPGTVNVSFASGGNVTRPTTTGDGDWWNAVLADLVAMRAADGVTGDVYYHGAVRTGAGGFTPATGGILGMGFRPGVAAATRFNVSVTDISGASSPADQQVIAHEVGHNLGRQHVPTVAGTTCYGTPDPNSLDAGWPHPNPLIAEVGFDVANGKAKREDQFTDIMAYCLPGWTSVYNYTSLMDSVTLSSGVSAVPQGQLAGEFWEVSGSINELSAVLNPIFDVDTTASTGAGSGPYRIEVRDGNGGLLFTRMFLPLESHWPGIAELESFFELIPVQAGAAQVAVFDPLNTLLVERELSGAAPAVEFGDVVPSGESINASWSVTDPDSSTHSYRLEFSTDGGANWHILIPHLDDPNVELDASTLPGSSQMQLRVQASDGAMTSLATSQTFVVPEHAPQAEIISPAGGTFRAGQLVPLLAAAFDADDGTLDDGAIAWSSDLDGPLGSGASLPVYDLSAGQHTITMTARDSDNNAVTDTVSVHVFEGPVVDAAAVADVDCDGNVGARDGLALLRHLAGLDAGSCKTIGSGTSILFGDADCNSTIGLGDVAAILKLAADLPAGCT